MFKEKEEVVQVITKNTWERWSKSGENLKDIIEEEMIKELKNRGTI